MKKLNRITRLSVVILAIFVVFIILILQTIPKYPSPNYSVDSYEELAEKMAVKPMIRLPKKEVLPGYKTGYEVYLVSRFGDEVDGYLIQIVESFERIENPETLGQDGEKPQDSVKSSAIEISCGEVSEDEKEEASFTPNQRIANHDVFISEFGEIIFYIDGFRYEIHPSEDIQPSLKEFMIPIAESIIQQ